MAATIQAAREYLSDDFMSDVDIIHALRIRADDFAEALFDLLELEFRAIWVSPHHFVIIYLLKEVGMEIRVTTGGSAPYRIMIRSITSRVGAFSWRFVDGGELERGSHTSLGIRPNSGL